MRMIFNHEDGQLVTQRGIIAAAQQRLRVEEKLKEIRMEDKRAEEAEEEVPPPATKRSKPTQATPAPEPAKKRQKPEPKKASRTVAAPAKNNDETESEESGKVPPKRTTPKPAAQKAEQLVMTH